MHERAFYKHKFWQKLFTINSSLQTSRHRHLIWCNDIHTLTSMSEYFIKSVCQFTCLESIKCLTRSKTTFPNCRHFIVNDHALKFSEQSWWQLVFVLTVTTEENGAACKNKRRKIIRWQIKHSYFHCQNRPKQMRPETYSE